MISDAVMSAAFRILGVVMVIAFAAGFVVRAVGARARPRRANMRVRAAELRDRAYTTLFYKRGPGCASLATPGGWHAPSPRD